MEHDFIEAAQPCLMSQTSSRLWNHSDRTRAKPWHNSDTERYHSKFHAIGQASKTRRRSPALFGEIGPVVGDSLTPTCCQAVEWSTQFDSRMLGFRHLRSARLLSARFTLPHPFAAGVGSCVLRSSESRGRP